MAGGGRLRDAGTRPRRVVAAAGPKMAGVVTGIDRGGRRSSGELGVDATVAGEARARHLRVPGSAGRKLSTTAGPLGGRRHVSGDHRRRRVSVIKGATATATKRRGKEGETVAELTGVATVASGSSGRRRRRRIASGELQWPATERRWWRRPSLAAGRHVRGIRRGVGTRPRWLLVQVRGEEAAACVLGEDGYPRPDPSAAWRRRSQWPVGGGGTWPVAAARFCLDPRAAALEGGGW